MNEVHIDAGMSINQAAARLLKAKEVLHNSVYCIFNGLRLECYSQFTEDDIVQQYDILYVMRRERNKSNFPDVAETTPSIAELNQKIDDNLRAAKDAVLKLGDIENKLAQLALEKSNVSEHPDERALFIRQACYYWKRHYDSLNRYS